MLPFVLANPSRSANAAVPASVLEPTEAKVRAFYEERDIKVALASNMTTVPGPTGSWEHVATTTYHQTQITFTPAADFSNDEEKDDNLEHNNNDDQTPWD